MGRKNKYETHVKPRLKDIQEWYQLLNEEQIAKKLGIAVSSFENYKNKYPELKEALTNGKQTLIEDLKNSLKKKAKGFTYKEKKVTIRQENGKEVKTVEQYEKYSPPDTGAIHLLLKNLDEDWRNDDKSTIEMKKKQLELTERKIEQNEW